MPGDDGEAQVACRILNLRFAYQSQDRRLEVFDGLTFDIRAARLTVILGPSGCGKSTVLHLLAGLIRPETGEISFGASLHTDDVGIVFQSSSLLPWRTVQGNAALGAILRGHGATRARRRADELLERYGLAEFRDRSPRELSGGMKQRLAIVRALAADAKLLLMDEPFVHVDVAMRDTLERDLVGLVATEGRTVVLVTHDLLEAVRLADECVLFPPHERPVRHALMFPSPLERNLADPSTRVLQDRAEGYLAQLSKVLHRRAPVEEK